MRTATASRAGRCTLDNRTDGRVAVLNARVAELEQLAAQMLASYHQGSDGYRGRVGQVQIARWRKTLAGDQ